MTRLTITITDAWTAQRIEETAEELGISAPDVVGLAMRGKIPK